ncbi:hypothetical protein [Pseudoalteromonas marina]|uniref:hypothetical protein n=1 Tax=Pseudoalteromonas marina TaxID=267375 RepID=UPI002734EBFB|nr:hypothetical protein [Pseudoalteromonas marina]MDP2487495.1 hypothetical protein [Pseudoalteromonas marina]
MATDYSASEVFYDETLANLCMERKESSKNPIDDGFTRYIGLEHLQTDSVSISKWGSYFDDKPSFTRVFRKGDVLLCKRRPYLRKASQVNFDGVCSGDVIVLMANENKIIPELLPHVVHTPDFWNFAVKTSSGSLSPRTKFALLKDFSIKIPHKDRQEELLVAIKQSMKIDNLVETSLESINQLLRVYKKVEMPLMHAEGSYKIGDFLRESRIDGSNGKLAKKLTVKLYGNGIISKEDNTGSENTKYFKRKAGQFIYSKLDFLNGAFAVVPESLDGYESTLDLPAFDVSDDLYVGWLFHYVNRPEFYEEFTHSAKGGRKAKRISPKDFLSTKIPYFSKQKQKAQLDIIEAINLQKHLLIEKLASMRKVRQKIIFGK